MDKSKAYIKKMQKADEILSLWKPKNGDYFYGTPEDFMDEDWEQGIYQYFECEDEYYCIIPKYYDYKDKEFTELDHDQIFLPSQKDLQSMLLFDTPYDMVKEFSDWCSELSVSMQERFTTMEQLWLGFVMYKNHSKVWNGKDWIFNK